MNKTVIKVNGTMTAFINFAPFVNRYRIHIPNVIGKTKENSDIINCTNGITCRIQELDKCEFTNQVHILTYKKTVWSISKLDEGLGYGMVLPGAASTVIVTLHLF